MHAFWRHWARFYEANSHHRGWVHWWLPGQFDKKLKICDRLVGIERSPENCEYILEKGLVIEIVEEVPEDTS